MVMGRYNTYKFLAGCLSLECGDERRDEILEAVSSGKVNWPEFFLLGGNHLILQTIYRIFNSQDITAQLPSEVTVSLKNIFLLNRERNNKIMAQALEIQGLLSAGGITPLFLKGTGHVMNGLYSDPAERLMADIDLLVEPGNIEKAVECLVAAGYQGPLKIHPERAHLYKKHHPGLFKPGMPAFVEIHWEAVRPPNNKTFSSKKILERRTPSLLYPDCYTLDMEDHVVHNFIHSQLEHGGDFYARVYLRNMYDMLLLSKHCSPERALAPYEPFRRESARYLFLIDNVFDVGMINKQGDRRSRLYLFRYNMNLRFYLLVHLLKCYKRFILTPIMLLGDKKMRRHKIRNLRKKEWYRKFFGKHRNKTGNIENE